MNLREIQRPLKQRYREDGTTAQITLTAGASQQDVPVKCAVHAGEQSYPSEAHVGVGGPGTAPCSGDLMLASLAACAQITCQMVATAMSIPVRSISASADGDLDLRGTLGVSREAPVGFTDIRLSLHIDAPEASEEQIASLVEKTEQYCVIMQTLKNPPSVSTRRV
jgi:uncharacterized OsmC-like protein